MARAVSEQTIRQLAQRHRPRGWRLFETKHRTKTQSGFVVFEPVWKRKIEVPRLTTLYALFVAFHEFGHVHCRHHENGVQPAHVDEFQAEMFAVGLFRTYLLPISRTIWANIHTNLLAVIAQDEANSVEIWPEIRRWTERA